MKVKVLGAGSIGNHLSNASRALGWSVDLVDRDASALERTRTSIYPARYGAWDDEIRLFESADAPVGGYDLIVIGTPPDVHVELTRAAIAEKPRAILVEKPVCRPDLEGAQALVDEAHAAGVSVFVGYDHVVGKGLRTGRRDHRKRAARQHHDDRRRVSRVLGRHFRGASLVGRSLGNLSRVLAARWRCLRRALPRSQSVAALRPFLRAPGGSSKYPPNWTSCGTKKSITIVCAS